MTKYDKLYSLVRADIRRRQPHLSPNALDVLINLTVTAQLRGVSITVVAREWNLV